MIFPYSGMIISKMGRFFIMRCFFSKWGDSKYSGVIFLMKWNDPLSWNSPSQSGMIICIMGLLSSKWTDFPNTGMIVFKLG